MQLALIIIFHRRPANLVWFILVGSFWVVAFDVTDFTYILNDSMDAPISHELCTTAQVHRIHNCG